MYHSATDHTWHHVPDLRAVLRGWHLHRWQRPHLDWQRLRRGAGTGILSTAGQVAVDTTVIATQAFVNTAVTGMAKKYAGALNGSASPETITHNLNTQDITVMVHNSASPFQFVQVDWAALTVNTVQITYNPALGAGWRVVVVG